MAPQSTATNGFPARLLWRWISCATMLLARAAGTVHQYRHVRRRDEPHIFVELPRGIALPLDIVGHIPAAAREGAGAFSGIARRDIAHGRRCIERLADLF